MITILTPTYNRAHTLGRLFFSLETQNDRRFEWIVVDDGSTDSTKQLLSEFISKSTFSMQVVNQENSGKHAAINSGVINSKSEWIFIVDSDDALTQDAVFSRYQELRSIGTDINGLCFPRRFFKGKLVGRSVNCSGPISLHPSQAGSFFQGDLAYVFRRDSLLKYPFPLIPGERFVPELYIWNIIGDNGKILYFADKAIYECEYLSDGYSANFSSNLFRNPQGFLLFYVTQAPREFSWLGKLKCLYRCLQCIFFIVFKGNAK